MEKELDMAETVMTEPLKITGYGRNSDDGASQDLSE